MAGRFRKCWLITHANNGSYLQYSMFKSDRELESVDECHYTSDAAVVYTYLHFKRSIAMDTMTKFLDGLRGEHDIVLFQICGYGSIASSSVEEPLTEHVGFRVLLKHYQTKHPLFRACTDGKACVSRGQLWRLDSLSRLRQIAGQRSRAMRSFLASMEAELAEYKQKAQTVDLMQEQLMEYEARFERFGERIKELNARVNELGHFQFVCHVLKSRVRTLDAQAQMMVLAPDHRGRPLFNE